MVDLSPLASDPYPGLSLLVGGAIAIFVAVYGRRDDSYLDEVGTFVAFILGIAIAAVCIAVVMEDAHERFSMAVLALLALCLFLKPLKGLPWSGIFGLVAGTAAAFVSSMLLPSEMFGIEEWKVLLAIFLIIGGIVWLLTRFIQGVLAISSTVVSWKVSIVVIGVVAIAEGVALIATDSSIASFL